MNSDAIPEILYPNPKKQDRYVVLSGQFDTESFAEALAKAERCCRTTPGLAWGIYKLDSTVELVNGIISVRAES